MRVLLFAGLAEACGKRSLEVDEIVSSVAELRTFLERAHPELVWQGVRIAVNQEYADDARALTGREEIAAIPPVSGG
ncbi:MAG: molybdopterin converting factor subunit 1 [Planctomycetes bacterium]|nr:molybdopterin converting factor subunit 1 [Planctomycetota bacterium]